ncbi:MAG: ABC transporter permease, partial [Chloroflexota bacterium]
MPKPPSAPRKPRNWRPSSRMPITAAKPRNTTRHMSILETFRVALEALLTNRLRALLTTLGIVIGVASVVSLMSLGGSLQSYIQSQFVSLGA